MSSARALKILLKDAEFLGLTFSELIEFIEKHPLAQTRLTTEAYIVYKESSLCV